MNNENFKNLEKKEAQKLITSEALQASKNFDILNNSQNGIFDVRKMLSNQSNSPETKEDLLNYKNSTYSDIRQINISYCALTQIPVVIFSLKYLTLLNLSNNFLEDLPKEIGTLCNLVTLKLSRNKLNNLPQSLKNVQHLNYLDLSCNSFTEVPEVLYYSLRTLTILDLSCNQISKFDDPPGCLNKLIALGLSDNYFKQLPVWIFDSLCQLQYLDISQNNFYLDTKFTNYSVTGVYESLQLLNVESCNLNCKNFENLSVFKKLKVLYMGNDKDVNEKKKKKNNYMGDLNTNALAPFQKISNLHLQNVQIATLPNDFTILKNIEVLNLSDNMLSWLPESFCELVNLKILNLTSNQLLFLPTNIGKLKSLKQIHLGNNKICQIPDSFYNLTNLEYVDFYNNEIGKVELRIFKEKNLKGIDLGLNCLVFDFCENGIDLAEIKILYGCLRDSFRMHFSQASSRCDLQMTKVNKGVNETSSDSYSCSNTISVSSFENEQLSDLEDLSQNPAQTNSTEDDDWDLHQDEKDELFDPNVTYSLPQSYIDWKPGFESNYCPANYHVPSVMKTYLTNFRAARNENVEEGQFDSD